MNFRITRIGWAATVLYGVAIIISIIVGGFLPVAIIGAVLLGAINTLTGGARGRNADGRNRNRNRERG